MFIVAVCVNGDYGRQLHDRSDLQLR